MSPDNSVGPVKAGRTTNSGGAAKSDNSAKPGSAAKAETRVEFLEPPGGDIDVVGGEAFETFYRREYPGSFSLAYALCGSTGMAEDVAQEAYLAAFGRWDQLTEPSAWIRRVVANKSVSTIRRRASEAKAVFRLGRPSDQGPDASLPIEAEELWAQVRQLPKRQAQMVALRYVEGLSTVEAAEVLGISTNTAKTHLKRAKQSLAKDAIESDSEES